MPGNRESVNEQEVRYEARRHKGSPQGGEMPAAYEDVPEKRRVGLPLPPGMKETLDQSEPEDEPRGR